MFTLLIATHNTHKMRELKSMLAIPEIDLITLHAYPEYVPPEEDGASFEEIAQKKALDAAQKLGVWTLADDSGLVVPALGGSPGIRSSRFAGKNSTDRDNRQKLLEMLREKGGVERAAYFQCTLALASPEKIERCVTGVSEGSILEEERGGQGFGYDPLFCEHFYKKTYAEMSEPTKNQISHRRKAIDKILPFIETQALLKCAT